MPLTGTAQKAHAGNRKDVGAHLPEQPAAVNVLWDTSYSMEDRDLASELRFLDAFLSSADTISVRFQAFGYRLEPPVEFEIIAGDWEALQRAIENCVHDGATNPELLQQFERSGLTLLFTDGRRFPESAFSKGRGRIVPVSSQREAAHDLLSSIAWSSGGNYLPLHKVTDLNRLLTAINDTIPPEPLYRKEPEYPGFRQINGVVTDFDDPLSNVVVQVQGTGRGTRTDTSGNFSIPAGTNEILDFSYPGRQGTEAVVNNSTSLLKITMPLGVKVLDEVVLEQQQETQEAGKPLPGEVTTNFGTLDAEKSGFAVKQISGEKLSWAAQTITDALVGKFPGVRIIGGSGPNARVMLRAGSRAPAAWDVDGIQYAPENPPLHINVQNIESITVMPGSWAGARYGRMAAGGIVMVRTISQSVHRAITRQDALRQRSNYYQGDAVIPVRHETSLPGYLRELATAGSVSDAYSAYLNIRPLYRHRASFFFDVQKWFASQPGGNHYARRILSNLEEGFEKDPTALKVAAYSLEYIGDNREALEIYRRIHKIQPNSQSLRDLARIHAQTGQHRRAWSLYNYYLGRNDSLYARGTDRIVREEMLGLLRGYGTELGIETSLLQLEENQNDLSLLVEWNNPNTRFELQFVGPEGLFYRWDNTVDSTGKTGPKGYLSEIFEIADISKGGWMVNVRYLGNRESTPSFLKFTVLDHRNNREDIRLLKLDSEKTNLRFLELHAGEIVSAMP